jgi:hypothetical protein
MWEDIDKSQATKKDILWIAEELKAGTLIWTTVRSYKQKMSGRPIRRGVDHIFAKRRTFDWQDHSGKNPRLQAHSRQRC